MEQTLAVRKMATQKKIQQRHDVQMDVITRYGKGESAASIASTYARSAQWALNILARNGVEIRSRGEAKIVAGKRAREDAMRSLQEHGYTLEIVNNLLNDKKASLGEIASECGITRSLLTRMLRDAGFKGRSGRNWVISEEVGEHILELYRGGMTYAEVAEEVGISIPTINRYVMSRIPREERRVRSRTKIEWEEMRRRILVLHSIGMEPLDIVKNVPGSKEWFVRETIKKRGGERSDELDAIKNQSDQA